VSWLLDTDVLCQPAKRNGDPRVIAWLERERDRCYTSAVVIAQLAYWVRSKQGRQREALQAWLTRLIDAMHGRIHGFNVSVAHVWAAQEHSFERAGKRMPVEDSYIAATAKRYGLTIVTGNDRDFRRPGLRVFNPFKDLLDPDTPSPRR
jgi:toxin FitB